MLLPTNRLKIAAAMAFAATSRRSAEEAIALAVKFVGRVREKMDYYFIFDQQCSKESRNIYEKLYGVMTTTSACQNDNLIKSLAKECQVIVQAVIDTLDDKLHGDDDGHEHDGDDDDDDDDNSWHKSTYEQRHQLICQGGCNVAGKCPVRARVNNNQSESECKQFRVYASMSPGLPKPDMQSPYKKNRFEDEQQQQHYASSLLEFTPSRMDNTFLMSSPGELFPEIGVWSLGAGPLNSPFVFPEITITPGMQQHGGEQQQHGGEQQQHDGEEQQPGGEQQQHDGEEQQPGGEQQQQQQPVQQVVPIIRVRAQKRLFEEQQEEVSVN
jgi:hypothetical protein